MDGKNTMKKYGLAALSGLLVGLSFPTVLFRFHLPNLGFLAWVGLIPLVITLYEANIRQAFKLGFVFAVVCNLITEYWMYTALNTFGHIQPLFSIFTLLLLVVFMALYIGAALAASRFFTQKKGELLVFLPVFWTLAEWARNYTPFGGFPWASLAGTQHGYLVLLQLADVTGAYGIVFLIVWFNVWLSELFLKWQKRETQFFGAKTIITVMIFAVVLAYGLHKLSQEQKQAALAPHLKIGLIQPNISQEEKSDEAQRNIQKTIFGELVQSLERNVDLIVWPESSWTELAWLESTSIPPQDIGLSVARGNRPYTLLGLDFVTAKGGAENYFNSAALLDSAGTILGKYHKVHLVPFGEYVPLKKLFSFLKPVAAIGNFQAGKELSPLSLDNWKIGPLICFEDIFPEISRTLAKKGANLLINITNDAWYGISSAPYHHLALASLRAVETRRAMVRATNTGVTAVIEPTGKIAVASPLFEKGVLVHQVPLLSHQTLYTKLGDWFIWACLLFVLWQSLKVYVERN